LVLFGGTSELGSGRRYSLVAWKVRFCSLSSVGSNREVAMLMVRDHGVGDYAVLPDMDATDVGVLTDDDRDCLDALGEYLVSAGAWRRFAIWLLHKHFEPAPGEVFVERTITKPRQTHTTPIRRAAFSRAGLSATAMRFDTAEKTGLGLVGMEFAVPVDLGSAAPVSLADEAVLAGLAEILHTHGKADRFGIRLIRDRLGLSKGEALLETCDVAARALHCEVTDRGVIPARSIETSWQWEPVITKTGPTPVMECQTTCTTVCLTATYCDTTEDGGHSSRSEHQSGGHETSGHISD
jgi:hypothetical protein